MPLRQSEMVVARNGSGYMRSGGRDGEVSVAFDVKDVDGKAP